MSFVRGTETAELKGSGWCPFDFVEIYPREK